jgi:undecaprenyl-diphosphatase
MDQFLFQQLNQFAGKCSLLDNLAIFFAKYFEYILIILVFLIFWRKWKVIFQSFLAAILARFGIVEIIRYFFPRPRPFIENHVNLLLDKINQSSFPSGHAAFYFALSTVVYSYNKKAGTLFFIASFLIIISRVFVGVHWPSDILAGAIVGIFSGWLVLKLTKIKFKKTN